MMSDVLVDAQVAEAIRRLELPFNRYGLDPYGISRDHLEIFFSMLAPFYRTYFRVRCFGQEHVPAQGRVMVVGNHSGGLPVDGAMVLASLLLGLESPRLGQGMVEKFANRWPFVSHWFSRVGQFTGLPEHAERLLEDERCLMVFPEGARGTGKLYRDRYKLVRFGSGFVRLAMKTNTPIVPFAFIGGEEAIPTVRHLKGLAKMIGAPYIPLTSYGLPLPLPVACQIFYGEPLVFEGTGTETDDVILGHVQRVQDEIAALIERGRTWRRGAVERGELEGGMR
ncbi:acyltransferase family protein [Lujinxingia vulgaris]|uniref:Acyltransferase family protein n=2 Tax=Lujinxingia vulgaris TaxID=2600176 RepID=A0A5C6X3T5_9DELT|nr:lysophospholipid acyltransferase family protein [Lujinxingia vulgaris]TXD36394.1 acyltransferase family protein [Lujinxingia vulgaris]